MKTLKGNPPEVMSNKTPEGALSLILNEIYEIAKGLLFDVGKSE